MKRVEKLTEWPEAFAAEAKAINDIIDSLNAIINMEGRNGILITTSDDKIVVEIGDDTENDGAGGSGLFLPSGSAGDMLYHDGSGWVSLPAPSVGSADPVLRHDGSAPYWEEPEGCV